MAGQRKFWFVLPAIASLECFALFDGNSRTGPNGSGYCWNKYVVIARGENVKDQE